MPYMDIMMEDCLVIKLRPSVWASVVLTPNADLLTIMKTALKSTVRSPITLKMKLEMITKKTVDTSGTTMKLKLVSTRYFTFKLFKIHTKSF